jgi:hypothetical protein
MIVRVVLILVLLAGCGRPLTPTEAGFAQKLNGDQLDLGRVRLVEGAPLATVTFEYKARPRDACRERILPEPKTQFVKSKPAALTLFNTVYFSRQWYTEDYLPDYPDKIDLVAAMLLAHELTHVWQWQNRDRTGYSPLRAAAEHGRDADPYLFDLAQAPNFLDYGYEQQGAIVEEYVCCRALAPDGDRTKRLHAMLSAAFPVADLPGTRRESDVYLPWKGADLNGICA